MDTMKRYGLSYYRQAAANLLAAEKEPAQRSLFADT